jgi:hypothetical protein
MLYSPNGVLSNTFNYHFNFSEYNIIWETDLCLAFFFVWLWLFFYFLYLVCFTEFYQMIFMFSRYIRPLGFTCFFCCENFNFLNITKRGRKPIVPKKRLPWLRFWVGVTCRSNWKHWLVEGLYCKRPIQCLWRLPKYWPSPPGECVPPAYGAGGGHTRWVERGVGVNILEDAKHCSVLYICKYFVHWVLKRKPEHPLYLVTSIERGAQFIHF